MPLLDRLPQVPRWAAADRGTGSHACREHIRDVGARPVIATKRNEAAVACSEGPRPLQPSRAALGGAAQAFGPAATGMATEGRLKEWRAAAMRHGRTASSFRGVLCFAACDWFRNEHVLGIRYFNTKSI